MMYNESTNTVYIAHYTEQEVAEFLMAAGINKLASKNEKLVFARTKLAPIAARLWSQTEETDRRKVMLAERLVRRIESLDGLTAIVKLASILVPAVR